MNLRFIAEDANQGSLVGAALDDLELWDENPVGIAANGGFEYLVSFPNPAGEVLHVKWQQTGKSPLSLTLTDPAGRTVYAYEAAPGETSHEIPVTRLAAGVYLLKASSAEGSVLRKVNIAR